MKDYTEYIIQQAQKLLSIDSPSGYTEHVSQWLLENYREMGYDPQLTTKGGVLVQISRGTEENTEDPAKGPVMLMAHTDTLGAMVSSITGEGRLKLSPLGGMNANNAEAENCRIITREGKTYTGTFQLCNASIHVNGEYNDTKRTYKDMEVLLDELVTSAEEVKALGIMTGDIVCFDPRTVVTPSGFIKSRFLDDKLSAAILLGLARAVREDAWKLNRKVSLLFTVYEEVGHGGSVVPDDTEEMISVDMGCVGSDLGCTERMVSICAKDSGGPYNYDLITALSNLAKEKKLDYAIDVYPHYGSDVETTLRAGYDIRHGLIGPGVYASHNYERSHMDGVHNTFELLKAYITR